MARDASSDGYGVWRSLVAHLVWDQGVGGSNPLAPTIRLRNFGEAKISFGVTTSEAAEAGGIICETALLGYRQRLI